jgi:hypothetical protein
LFFRKAVLTCYRKLTFSKDYVSVLATGWTTERVAEFDPRHCKNLHVVVTDSGAHPASYPVGTGGKEASGVKLTTSN